MDLRPYLVVFSSLAVLAAAACGGKTAAVGPGDGGPPGNSSSGSGSGSGSGSSSGIHGGSASGSGGPAPGCTADSTVDCTPGAQGYACAAGVDPAAYDPTLSCSTPTPSSAGDLYCCFGFSSGGATCTPDDQLTTLCPDPASYGYQCAAGDDPATYDPNLSCSAPTPDPDGVHDDYCCTYPSSGSSGSSSGGPAPAGCVYDSTLDCVGGADGYACAIGDNPEADGSLGLSCSTPTLSAGEDDYCCFSGGNWSPASCEPDDTLTAVCPDPTSYGYVCASGDDPTSYDATLNCSVPVPDADGVHDDFCCTY